MALVITVIVLLILAGTAISIAINGGDIFGKASQARESWNSAVATEEQKVNEVWQILNTMTGGNTQPTKQWEIVTDSGDAGLSVGDLVRPTVTGVTSEQFYVIGIDGSGDNQTVRLLAEKNVETTGYTQSSSANPVAFDSTEPYSNEYASSTIKDLVDNYTGTLTGAGLTLQDIEITNEVSAKGRLMLLSEVVNLGGNAEEWTTDGYTETTAFVGTINYWLGTVGNGDEFAKVCGWGGALYSSYVPDDYDDGGEPITLRPVIVISRNMIEE